MRSFCVTQGEWLTAGKTALLLNAQKGIRTYAPDTRKDDL
jgi:hypothetical protein